MAVEFVTPPAMEPGDRVAVIAPSSGSAHARPHLLELGLERLRSVFDLEPEVYPTARQGDQFLRDHPRARAADVHAAFRDPDISGIVATIGGADQLRILRHLDPTTLRDHPTRFFGMSDNTNLGLFLWTHGIVSYNGGQLLNEIATPGEIPDYTERYVRRAFFEETLGELVPSEEWTDEPSHWWADPSLLEERPSYEPNPGRVWAGSRSSATGRLWGGNLSIIEWQLASDRYVPDPERLDGTVLGVETAQHVPEPKMVGATLMTMGERGLLERFSGVLVGRPPTRSHLVEKTDAERVEYRNDVYDTVVEWIGRYNPDAPIVLGLDWGHTNPIAPLALGRTVEIRPDDRTVVVQ
jgi:muramoyltetrapeptide carboxypeptidase LdcA involved in peptidoglycan recycling